jgi:hypothetical protein
VLILLVEFGTCGTAGSSAAIAVAGAIKPAITAELIAILLSEFIFINSLFFNSPWISR